jgi:hypothetical protein
MEDVSDNDDVKDEDDDYGRYNKEGWGDEKRYSITEDVLQARSRHGMDADQRLLDLPWLEPEKPSWSSKALSTVPYFLRYC